MKSADADVLGVSTADVAAEAVWGLCTICFKFKQLYAAIKALAILYDKNSPL